MWMCILCLWITLSSLSLSVCSRSRLCWWAIPPLKEGWRGRNANLNGLDNADCVMLGDIDSFRVVWSFIMKTIVTTEGYTTEYQPINVSRSLSAYSFLCCERWAIWHSLLQYFTIFVYGYPIHPMLDFEKRRIAERCNFYFQEAVELFLNPLINSTEIDH